ncbi:MAG: glycerophosphodiester phosphodiesterase [Actinomycetota bacterium]|nr:glycerophosphodiester phosphodiesterase [Actinomycetota bacterium]
MSITSPFVLAHRGAGSARPHNSLEAIVWAAEQKALGCLDGVEIDARLTASGDLVISHDDEIDGGLISRLTTEQAVAKGVPLLADVLEVAKDLIVDLELKGPVMDPRAFGHSVVQATSRYPMVIVTSFWLDLLTGVQRAGFRGDLGVLTAASYDPTGEHAVAAAAEFGWAWAAPQAAELSVEGIDKLHERARSSPVRLLAWTIDDRAAATLLFEHGFEGVITDQPSQVKGC